MRAKKLSGAARRKIQREAARRNAGAGVPPGAHIDAVLQRPRIGMLETVSDIARELRCLFRRTLENKELPEEATKKAFVGTAALKATEAEEQLRQIDALHRQLAELKFHHPADSQQLLEVLPAEPVPDLQGALASAGAEAAEASA